MLISQTGNKGTDMPDRSVRVFEVGLGVSIAGGTVSAVALLGLWVLADLSPHWGWWSPATLRGLTRWVAYLAVISCVASALSFAVGLASLIVGCRNRT